MIVLVLLWFDMYLNDVIFNFDFGVMNVCICYMLSGLQCLFGNFLFQWLLYGGEGIVLQLGVNVIMLIDDVMVGFVEYVIGCGSVVGDFVQIVLFWVLKFVMGVIYIFVSKLLLMFEYDYDGVSVSGVVWWVL